MLKEVKTVIAQVNTVSIDDVLKRKENILEEIKKEVASKNLDLFVFAITDIVNGNSQAIVFGDKSNIVERAYNVKLFENSAFLEGVVSRKKQIIPILTKEA